MKRLEPKSLFVRLSVLFGIAVPVFNVSAATLVNNSGQTVLVSNGLVSNGAVTPITPGNSFLIPSSWGDTHQVYAIIKLNGLSLCGNQYGVAKIPTSENQEITPSLTCVTYTNNIPVPTPTPAPTGSVLLPYIQLNVDEMDRFYWYKGQASMDNSEPVSTVSSYFPTLSDGTPSSSYTLSGDSAVKSYFSFGSHGQLFQTKPLTKSEFANLAKSCQQINNDPNKVTCTLQVNSAGGLYGSQGNLPIILYAGLRAYNTEELIRDLPAFDGNAAMPNRWDKDNNSVNKTAPYLLEISAEPIDFSSSTTIVDLHKYFYSPSNTEKFSFDASKLNNGNPTSCNIVRINGVDGVASTKTPVCADKQFQIDSKGNLLAQGLTEGIYQINIKASENTENAWQTFYLNVGNSNPSLSSWRAGNVATNNLISDFSSIYVYSTQDPTKSTGWPSDYVTYGKDLSHINKILGAKPIKTVLAEIMNMNYTFVDPNPINYKISFWKLSPNNNPESQVTASGISTNRTDSDFANWIGQLVDPQSGALASQGVGLTLNYAFDNNVKADLIGLNPKQQDIMADKLVHPVIYASTVNPNYKVDGLAMDLEAGFNPHIA